MIHRELVDRMYVMRTISKKHCEILARKVSALLCLFVFTFSFQGSPAQVLKKLADCDIRIGMNQNEVKKNIAKSYFELESSEYDYRKGGYVMRYDERLGDRRIYVTIKNGIVCEIELTTKVMYNYTRLDVNKSYRNKYHAIMFDEFGETPNKIGVNYFYDYSVDGLYYYPNINGEGVYYHTESSENIFQTFYSENWVIVSPRNLVNRVQEFKEERNKSDFNKQMEQGRKEMRQGNYSSALLDFRKAFSYCPQDSIKYSFLVDSCNMMIFRQKADKAFQNKSYDTALTYYSKAYACMSSSYDNQRLKETQSIINLLSTRATQWYSYNSGDLGYSEIQSITQQALSKILEEQKYIPSTQVKLEIREDLNGRWAVSCTTNPKNTAIEKAMVGMRGLVPHTNHKAFHGYTVNAIATLDYQVSHNLDTIAKSSEYGRSKVEINTTEINHHKTTTEKTISFYDRGGYDNIPLSIIFPVIAGWRVSYGLSKDEGFGTTLLGLGSDAALTLAGLCLSSALKAKSLNPNIMSVNAEGDLIYPDEASSQYLRWTGFALFSLYGLYLRIGSVSGTIDMAKSNVGVNHFARIDPCPISTPRGVGMGLSYTLNF